MTAELEQHHELHCPPTLGWIGNLARRPRGVERCDRHHIEVGASPDMRDDGTQDGDLLVGRAVVDVDRADEGAHDRLDAGRTDHQRHPRKRYAPDTQPVYEDDAVAGGGRRPKPPWPPVMWLMSKSGSCSTISSARARTSSRSKPTRSMCGWSASTSKPYKSAAVSNRMLCASASLRTGVETSVATSPMLRMKHVSKCGKSTPYMMAPTPGWKPGRVRPCMSLPKTSPRGSCRGENGDSPTNTFLPKYSLGKCLIVGLTDHCPIQSLFTTWSR